MKKIFLLIIVTMGAHLCDAQVVKIDSLSRWKKKLLTNLNLNQSSFSSNWKAGGVNSVGFNVLFNYKADYSSGRHTWDNEIDLLYGFINNAGQGFRKNNDRIYLDTKYGYKIDSKWSLFTALNFLTQFSKGYEYRNDAAGVEQAFLISDILAPAFFTSSWGFEYTPATYFKLRIAPISPRLTFVKDVEQFVETVGEEPYGVQVGETTRGEWLAFQLLADFNKDVATNVNLKWRYMFYANYEELEPRLIDHRLDVGLNVKAGRFINVGVAGILVYDYDQDSGAQISQLFNIGFAYSFRNFEEK